MSDTNREYLRTHPWINFKIKTDRFTPKTWTLFGEITSKADHVANAPIAPARAKEFYEVFLAKGAAATTAIEGNTLTEEQVQKQVEGALELPKSQEYLQKEVQNILDASNGFVQDLANSEPARFCVQFVESLNAKALDGLTLEEGVVPGKIRRHDVRVARYKGAPVEDCYFLLEEMNKHIESFLSLAEDDEFKKVKAIIAALFSHVYIALIHPFGDGNGRTSRLLEVYILLQAGFPMPTCQLLSNHYNKTRNEYYRQLDLISKNGGDLSGFFEYALQGFADGLRDQVAQIQLEQVRVTWLNYIHDRFRSKATEAHKRRRDLALAISTDVAERSIDEILSGNLQLSRAYSLLADKTLTRDINELVRMQIILRAPYRKLRPNVGKITGFLPWRHD